MAYHGRLFSFSKARRFRHFLREGSQTILANPLNPYISPRHRFRRVHSASIPVLLLLPPALLASVLLSRVFTPSPPASFHFADRSAEHIADVAVSSFFSSADPSRPDPRLFADDTTNVRLLIDRALIPPVFVSRLSTQMRRRLLRRLTIDSNGLLTYSSIPKVLVVHLQNGLGNRLRALASALDIAYSTQRVPIILWETDAHINATMTRLFDPEVVRNLIIIEHGVSWPIDGNDVLQQHTNGVSSASKSDGGNSLTWKNWDIGRERASVGLPEGHPALSSFNCISHMEKDKGFTPPTHGLPRPDATRHLYLKTGYAVQPQWPRSYTLINTFMQALKPGPDVMKVVRDVQRRCGGLQAVRRMVGVHIRALPLALDNAAVDHECEYSIVGAERTNSYRVMSSPANFIPEMRRVQRDWPNIVRKSAGMTAGVKLSVRKEGDAISGTRKRQTISDDAVFEHGGPTSTLGVDTTAANASANAEGGHVEEDGEERETLRSIIEVDVQKPPQFFISADSGHAVQELHGAFGEDAIESAGHECEGRSAECIVYAFADLVVLSRTSAMLQSGWSSFSEAAGRLRARPYGMDSSRTDGFMIRMSGVDFGVPTAWASRREWLDALWRGVVGTGPSAVVSETQRRELCESRQKRGLLDGSGNGRGGTHL